MAREEETPVPKDFDENLTRTLAQLPARKRRRIPRAVLLAACLVLMLTGAVLAAESGVFARFGTPGDLNVEGLFYDGTEYGGTWTYSTDRRLPLADIPQASQEAARTSTEDLQFPDMAAADAFLGGGVLPRSAQQEARERDQVSIEAQCDQQGQLVRMYIRTAYWTTRPRAAARRIFSGRPYPVMATAIGRCSVRGPWWCSWISPS